MADDAGIGETSAVLIEQSRSPRRVMLDDVVRAGGARGTVRQTAFGHRVPTRRISAARRAIGRHQGAALRIESHAKQSPVPSHGRGRGPGDRGAGVHAPRAGAELCLVPGETRAQRGRMDDISRGAQRDGRVRRRDRIHRPGVNLTMSKGRCPGRSGVAARLRRPRQSRRYHWRIVGIDLPTAPQGAASGAAAAIDTQLPQP